MSIAIESQLDLIGSDTDIPEVFVSTVSKSNTDEKIVEGSGIDIKCSNDNEESSKEVTTNNSKPDETGQYDFPINHEKVEPFFNATINLQCPFSWQGTEELQNYGDHEIDLISDFEEMFEEKKFRFRRFIIHLIRCYHNFYKRLIEDSFENLKDLERMLTNTHKRESNDVLFNSINGALYHVVHSCRVYLYHLSGKTPEALQIIQKMVTFEALSPPNQAGIYGIRAAVCAEHGYDGVNAAIYYISKAVVLDPTNAYWHFMKGTYLGRLRRMEKSFDVPSPNEIRALETAVKLKGDPAFIAFTAEVYMEVTKTSIKVYKDEVSDATDGAVELLYSKMNELNARSANLFKKSIDLKPNSAHLLFRCGKGLMRLPEPHQDLDLAYKCIRNGLRLSENSSFGNHAMAMYKEKYGKNPKSAFEYLKKAVDKKNFPAHIDFCRLSFLLNEDVDDLIEELQEMLKIYDEPPKRCKILGELVCCFLFLDYNLVSACVSMMNMLLYKSKWMNSADLFHSGILPFSESVPLINIIASEIRRKLPHPEISEQDKNEYKKFIHYICMENIIISKNLPEKIRKIFVNDLFRGIEKRRNDYRCKKKKKENKDYDRATVRHINYGNKKKNEYHKYYYDERDKEAEFSERWISQLAKKSNRDNRNKKRESIVSGDCPSGGRRRRRSKRDQSSDSESSSCDSSSKRRRAKKYLNRNDRSKECKKNRSNDEKSEREVSSERCRYLEEHSEAQSRKKSPFQNSKPPKKRENNNDRACNSSHSSYDPDGTLKSDSLKCEVAQDVSDTITSTMEILTIGKKTSEGQENSVEGNREWEKNNRSGHERNSSSSLSNDAQSWMKSKRFHDRSPYSSRDSPDRKSQISSRNRRQKSKESRCSSPDSSGDRKLSSKSRRKRSDDRSNRHRSRSTDWKHSKKYKDRSSEEEISSFSSGSSEMRSKKKSSRSRCQSHSGERRKRRYRRHSSDDRHRKHDYSRNKNDEHSRKRKDNPNRKSNRDSDSYERLSHRDNFPASSERCTRSKRSARYVSPEYATK